MLLQEGIRYRVLDIQKEHVKVKESSEQSVSGDTDGQVEVTVIEMTNVVDKYNRMNCLARAVTYLGG